MSRVVVHIDRLVLRGVDPGDASAVSRAMSEELRRLLLISSVPAGSCMPPARYHGDTLRTSTPQDLGRAIGARVARRVMP